MPTVTDVGCEIDHPFLSAKTPNSSESWDVSARIETPGKKVLPWPVADVRKAGDDLEALPYFFLDYREIPAAEQNRVDRRLVPDGTWSGNLYDFLPNVILRLSVILRFHQTESRRRQDDTPVHNRCGKLWLIQSSR